MKQDDFKVLLARELAGSMEENAELEFIRIPKNNGIFMEAVVFREAESNLMPTVYLEKYRLQYENGVQIKEIAAKIREERRRAAVHKRISVSFFTNWQAAGEHVFPKLLNRKMNQELLEDVPHREFLDLAVVFYLQTEVSGLEQGTVLIHSSHLQVWGINEEILCRRALENALQHKKSTFCSMEEILMELLDKEDQKEDIPENNEPSSGLPMYVLTNQERHFGAASLLYPGVLERISERLSTDFYVLPSSIHECIIVPVSGNYTRAKLEEMVTEINQTYVQPQDILSDHVYTFSREEKILKL